MAEVFCIGAISGASGFPRMSLCAKYAFVAGDGWDLIEGLDQGQTHVDVGSGEDDRFYVHYTTKTLAGWPKLVFQVFYQDMFGRNELYGYGFIHIPTTPGLHTVECVTWRPAGTFMDQVWTFFLGATPQLKSLDLVHNPSDRFRLQTVAMGKIHLELSIIVRGFEKHVVAPKKKKSRSHQQQQLSPVLYHYCSSMQLRFPRLFGRRGNLQQTSQSGETNATSASGSGGAGSGRAQAVVLVGSDTVSSVCIPLDKLQNLSLNLTATSLTQDETFSSSALSETETSEENQASISATSSTATTFSALSTSPVHSTIARDGSTAKYTTASTTTTLLDLPNELLIQIALHAGFFAAATLIKTHARLARLLLDPRSWHAYTAVAASSADVIEAQVTICTKIHTFDHLVFGLWAGATRGCGEVKDAEQHGEEEEEEVYFEHFTFNEQYDFLGGVQMAVTRAGAVRSAFFEHRETLPCYRRALVAAVNAGALPATAPHGDPPSGAKIDHDCTECRAYARRKVLKSLFVFDQVPYSPKWGRDGFSWAYDYQDGRRRVKVQIKPFDGGVTGYSSLQDLPSVFVKKVNINGVELKGEHWTLFQSVVQRQRRTNY
ncbi:B9 domain-containing protein 2 [Physocladia obscura]|uniref:B9 domain-containing protein 2 n=1 Tax=Physocladia obscura TaxID=109957 RepID=A0AAD5T4P3_9FUNG|nr:B9 domain-containing protein 2 [Physocladia obscura]